MGVWAYFRNFGRLSHRNDNVTIDEKSLHGRRQNISSAHYRTGIRTSRCASSAIDKRGTRMQEAEVVTVSRSNVCMRCCVDIARTYLRAGLGRFIRKLKQRVGKHFIPFILHKAMQFEAVNHRSLLKD